MDKDCEYIYGYDVKFFRDNQRLKQRLSVALWHLHIMSKNDLTTYWRWVLEEQRRYFDAL